MFKVWKTVTKTNFEKNPIYNLNKLPSFGLRASPHNYWKFSNFVMASDHPSLWHKIRWKFQPEFILNSLGQGLLQSGKETWVVSVDVLLCLSLGVDKFALSVRGIEKCDLKTASHTWISEELVFEFSFTEICIDLWYNISGVFAIASASAVLDLENVGCVLVAENLIGLGASIHIFVFIY